MAAIPKHRLFHPCLLLIGAGLLVLYSRSLPTLLNRWSTEDYSYCYLVPPLFLYMVYQLRDRLPSSPEGPIWPGYAGLALVAVFHLAGLLGSLETLVYLSMWLSVASVLVLLLGSRSVKALAFPLFVLLFAIPAPPFITQMLTFKLRLLSSALSVDMLQMLGFSAYREGNIIDLGVTQLQVVDACSGLRYLFPTILVALVMGYFFNKKPWHRVVLVLFAIPVSILINSLRIVFLAVMAKSGFPEVAREGFLHDFSGWLIFILSILFLLGLSLALQRLSGRRQTRPGKAEELEPPLSAAAAKPRWAHGLVAAIVFLLLYFAQVYLVAARASPERKSFSNFQSHIGGWEGKRAYLDQKILDSLWADDYVTGTFVNRATGNALHLLVSYYSYQTTQHTAHAPTSCLLGGGWDLKGKEVIPPDPKTGRAFPVQQMVLGKGGQTILSNFWFQQRGRIITDEYLNKVYLFWDGVTQRRTDGALVRVEMVVMPGQKMEEAQAVLDGFVVELKEVLREHIPD